MDIEYGTVIILNLDKKKSKYSIVCHLSQYISRIGNGTCVVCVFVFWVFMFFEAKTMKITLRRVRYAV